jgi:hypothetical protein
MPSFLHAVETERPDDNARGLRLLCDRQKNATNNE